MAPHQNDRLSNLEEEVQHLKTQLASLHHTCSERANAGLRSVCLALQKEVLHIKYQHATATAYPMLAIGTAAELNLNVDLQQALQLQARYLHVLSKTLLLDCPRILVDGELSAKLAYSSPFVWRRGQERLRLRHREDGFPVLVKWKGSHLTDGQAMMHLFIDQEDQYWYLQGSDQIMELAAIFIGKN